MSEEQKKPQRTMEEIGTDYQRLALKAGDLSFKISAFKKDLALIQDQMQNLNFEALNIQRANEEAKKAPVATVTPINAPQAAPEEGEQHA